jgi:hypothetical protein
MRKPIDRAVDAVPTSTTSRSMLSVWKAASSESTRLRSAATSKATSPSPSVARSRPRALTAYPPDGNTA